jgi:excisionase family DNA binding protein
MDPRKTVLTTGDVAKICNVAPRTVSKWFDSGQLRGYRIPGSKDRRIPVEQLVRFMRAHGIPLNGLDSGRRRVLILDADAALCDTLRTALTRDGYEVATAASTLEAGSAAHEVKPHVVVVDVNLPDVSARLISRFFRSTADLQPPRLIGVAAGLTEARGQALVQDGFDAYLSKPFDARSLIRLMEIATTSSTIHEMV